MQRRMISVVDLLKRSCSRSVWLYGRSTLGFWHFILFNRLQMLSWTFPPRPKHQLNSPFLSDRSSPLPFAFRPSDLRKRILRIDFDLFQFHLGWGVFVCLNYNFLDQRRWRVGQFEDGQAFSSSFSIQLKFISAKCSSRFFPRRDPIDQWGRENLPTRSAESTDYREAIGFTFSPSLEWSRLSYSSHSTPKDEPNFERSRWGSVENREMISASNRSIRLQIRERRGRKFPGIVWVSFSPWILR